MTERPVRIGIVGAGANTRLRHVPGFRAIPDVTLAGVVNRSPASSARAAAEFSIPRVYPDWRALVEDPQIDAVMIGTWPNMHCEITCAALAAGKHVLTEARMARDAAEARRMLEAAQARPDLVAQIVPSPFGLAHDPFIRDLLAHDYIGELRELLVIGADDMFWDYSQPLHWRQDRELSGFNTLMLGILQETVLRWTASPIRVQAQTTIFESQRPAPEGELGSRPVTVPESVQILTQLPGGARGVYHLSGVALFAADKQIHLYGSRGTIRFESGTHDRLLCGRSGDKAARLIDVPEEQRGGWRVEAEFIGAIRGTETVRYTDFATGVQYMEFTEAVHRSAASNAPVELPLVDVG